MPPLPPLTPSMHTLRAAVRVVRCLGADGSPKELVRDAYRRLPTDGVFSTNDFVAAEATLTVTGLVQPVSDRLVPQGGIYAVTAVTEAIAVELLLDRILTVQDPPWLSAAVAGDELREEFIPDADLMALKSCLRDAAPREAFLLAMGSRFDVIAPSVVSTEGEEFVAKMCRDALSIAGRPELASSVQRLSHISGTLGYDILVPTVAGSDIRIEVKTIDTPPGDVAVHLSRREALVAVKDPRWRLAVCRAEDGQIGFAGWCSARTLAATLPTDRSPRARWSSIRLLLSDRDLNSNADELIGLGA